MDQWLLWLVLLRVHSPVHVLCNRGNKFNIRWREFWEETFVATYVDSVCIINYLLSNDPVTKSFWKARGNVQWTSGYYG